MEDEEELMKHVATGVVIALMVVSLTFGLRPGQVSAASLCVAPGGAGGCQSSIQAAVTAAAAGDTITVAAGTYNGNVVINKPLSLIGAGSGTTTINADPTLKKEGVTVDGVTSGTTLISGFTIQNSALSGVLVQNSSNVTISNNLVQHNDLNLDLATHSCAGAFPFDQDDCGEGIHLRGASFSQVLNNVVTHDAGGILLTDETAANHDNVIDGNQVLNNIEDCGITLPSHPSDIIPPTTPGGQPTFKPGFGVYNNKVTNNTSIGNGGAGIGIFASVPGTASYNNLVQGNTIEGNGNAGVSMHAHAPNQNLNGNQIIGNTIGTNNVFGDGDAGDFQTTGILLMSAVVTAKGTVITGNTITGNEIGIWLANTSGSTLSDNHITGPIQVMHAHPPTNSDTESGLPAFAAGVGAQSVGVTGQFSVVFNSTNPGNGMVLFGSGPGCNGLVETATQDQGAGTTTHTIVVKGNDLPGTAGDNGIQPGATYWYEFMTATASGPEIDNNGGKCYSVTIPAATFTP
jgi:parallel beta-helix repeat protein